MSLSNNPHIEEATKSLLNVPFNDFEPYHNPDGTGTIERGGTCIFLINELLRRLPNDPQLRALVIAARAQIHYASILEFEGEQYFFDPFLRMDIPVKIPKDQNGTVSFPAHPQDTVKSMNYSLKHGKKRRVHYLETSLHRTLNDVPSTQSLHRYEKPFVDTKPIPEIDITYERKSALALSLLTKVNGKLREYSFRSRIKWENHQMSSYNSAGPIGHSNHNPDIFRENLEPILARLKMGYDEFMEYVRHAMQRREDLRKEMLNKHPES